MERRGAVLCGTYMGWGWFKQQKNTLVEHFNPKYV
jgi:hypothetical protein